MKYTYEFDQAEERKFRDILSRLDDDEYTIIEEISDVIDEKDRRGSKKKKAVIEMDSEACLTIKLSMKDVKITGTLNDEETAVRKALEDHHTIKVKVKVNDCGMPTSVTADRQRSDSPFGTPPTP